MIYKHDKLVHNKKAASIIVPLLLKYFKVTSVLDVGCGIGTWLSVFKEKGVNNILGLDGEYVDKNLIYENINSDEYREIDLCNKFNLEKKFDLILCLEVAEHLPLKSAKNLIESLCTHSDTIIFSAAIPGQGGQNHINEQWLSFWVNLFSEYKFHPFDLLRPLIWQSSEIEWWYRQNIIIFSKKILQNDVSIRSSHSYIHPENYMFKLERIRDLEIEQNNLIAELNKWNTSEKPPKRYLIAFLVSIKKYIRKYHYLNIIKSN